MKIWVITPQAKGFLVDYEDSETKEVKTSAHSKRISAINEVFRDLPAKQQFHIILPDEEE